MCVSSRRNACFSCFVFQILTSKSSKCAFRRGETLVFHLSLFKFKRQNHQNVRFVEAKRLFFIQIQTPTFTNYWFLSVRTLVRTGSERSSGRVFISQNGRPDENSIGSPFPKSTKSTFIEATTHKILIDIFRKVKGLRSPTPPPKNSCCCFFLHLVI